MFSQKRHMKKPAMSAAAIAAASILSMAAARAADATGSPMVLTAYINGAGGESVLAGKYEAALTQIRKERSKSSEAYTAKLNNQCVTYAAMRQLQQALAACDEAVRAAKDERFNALRYAPTSTPESSYVAIAYSNRAVVHMMARDAEGAKLDMTRAKALAPAAEFVSKNLIAMQASAARIAQIDAAPARGTE